MGCPIGISYGPVTLIGMGTNGVGERIRALRKAKGLTQPVLSKAVGIDQSTLSDIERGAGFSDEIRMSLAEELETTCEYIMRGRLQQTEEMQRATRAVRLLSDEQRLELFLAIMQPGALDHEVEERIPATRTKPVSNAEEVIKRARIPSPQNKKQSKKTA